MGPFNGWHQLNLEPEKNNKPIILIGALNGSGKTTIHEGIQLAIFGKQSAPAKRSKLSYEKYLSGLTNSDAKQEDGGLVEIEFKNIEDATVSTYRLRRSWKVSKSRTQERLDVYVNGQLDKVLSESWTDKVQDIFPSRIAALFFFDGEQIEELADFEKLSDILHEAIYALLGLDLVDQLETDLNVLKKNKVNAKNSSALSSKVPALETELEKLENARIDQKECMNSTIRQLELRQTSIVEKEQEFQEIGGSVYEDFERLKNEQNNLKALIKKFQGRLRELSETELPLRIISDGIMNKAQRTIKRSVDFEDLERQLALLTERDAFFGEMLNQLSVSQKLKLEVRSSLEIDRKERTDKLGERPEYIGGLSVLNELNTIDELLPRTQEDVDETLVQLNETKRGLVIIERQLGSAPTQDQVAKIKGELNSLTKDRDFHEAELRKEEAQLASINFQLTNIKREITTEVEAILVQKETSHEVRRMAENINWVQDILKTFGRSVVDHNIEKIERFALASIQKLMRKTALITAVQVAPDTFEVTLKGDVGQGLDLKRLSAGERQLVATALLWALARAAERPYPTVIDTPLGRLDSKHRFALTEAYLPHASSQVILLSTDEEIIGKYYTTLEPHVTRSYTLSFNEEKRSTEIVEGYQFLEGRYDVNKKLSA